MYKLIKELPLAKVGTIVELIWDGIYKNWTLIWAISPSQHNEWIKKIWRNVGWTYFYTNRLEVKTATDNESENDNYRYDYGTYFLTREEAEKEVERKKAIIKVNKFIKEANWDWKYNQESEDIAYYIYLSYCGYKVSTIWYKTPVIIEYSNNSITLQEVIKRFKPELDLIFSK